MDTVLGILVVVGWVVAVSKLLLAVDRFVTRRQARRSEEQAAEARATAVVLAVDTEDPEALLHALGLIPVIDHAGLPWWDACELEAVTYPFEITGSAS